MTPEIEDLKRDYESVKGANRIGQLNARDNYFWTKIGTLLAHIEQMEKRIGEIVHLHEVSLGLADLDCLDEITDGNVQEYSDLKLYEKWQKKLNKEAGE